MSEEITIRRPANVHEYHSCQRAQRLAWGIADDSYVVPIATMVGAQLHGGIVLGAFLPDGEAVGVSFAFLGRSGGRLCLYSQLTGVVPGRQSTGLGYRLKLVQRDLALESGVDLIAWAFDPLQAGNARFNLVKLGATSGHYVDDMYGPRTDALNLGVPTDRLIAEWDLSAPPRPEAVASHEWSSYPHLIESKAQADGSRAVVKTHPAEGPNLLVEIPQDIAGLRARDPRLAEAWRLAVRESLTMAFSAGYRAVGFVQDRSEAERRAFYLLHR
ncbi:hypothetical protein [Singulisphaera acidiphila]|uniref:N-acetyltransferase domain-containing protein n=1 Tax=Singulisphaera acidiphila (strain ATCC BAA-1392 / DSM 18658 / VKM B-2454 / MOB10) TaxID=886293 RepID=L0DJX5_SINAD|nr:hypothetical protein [Singulisphaera acidiphila]AGA29694.1 hypothetical protein Sinac_5557 [Singulisphaera acidiphila DSM 18658]